MQTTSHFIWIELKAEIFSDIFVKIYTYLKENNIENILHFQNPLSPHITLYYLEKDLKKPTKEKIQNNIKNLDIKSDIFLSGYNYFSRWEGNRFVLYFSIKTDLPLEKYRDILHKKYNRDFVEDNNFTFTPHITFLRINNSEIFEKHRNNIENIIKSEIENLQNININSEKIYLYAVNSKFKEEIQIKL